MGKLADIGKQLFAKKDKSPNSPLEEINDINDQPEDEKKLVAYVKEKIDSARQNNSRIALEGVYLTNVAYLLGYDGVSYDTNLRQFKNADPKRRNSRSRFKVNKILPTIQNRLARLTQSPPRFDVRPNSNSAGDKDASRLGLEILLNIFDIQRFNDKRQEVLMSAMQGGHAYVQTTWDPTLGKPMVDPGTNKFIGYEGDVRLEVLNCLEVFPDPLAKTIEDAGYIIKAKVRKLDYFRDRYPDRGDAVKEESAWLMSSIYDMKANAMSSVGISGSSTQDQMKNTAIEIVYYEKRSSDYPNGRKIVIANGVLLEDKELPIGEFDIVKFDDIMVGGRFNAEAVITHLRPVQDQYNILRAKCADWIKKMLAGKYLVAKGSDLSQESLNNESGEVLEFNVVPNAPAPTAMSIPQIPAYVYKDMEALDKEFDFVSGINEISRGVLPSASIPASGMAFLQEQDQTRIGVQTNRNEMAYAKIGQHVLKYVSKNYKMPRVLKIAGDGLQYAVKEFVGADILDNHDVIVVPGSTIPSSKVLRRQDILNSFQMGLLGDPADPVLRAHVLSMIEEGDTNELWKKQALDLAQTKKIIEAIEKGDEALVKATLDEFDNHAIRLQKMNEYRISDKFAGLDDEKKKFFKWVMEWDLQALVNINNPEIPQQQILAQTMTNNLSKMAPPQPQINPVVNANGAIQAPPPQAAPPPQQMPQQTLGPKPAMPGPIPGAPQ